MGICAYFRVFQFFWDISEFSKIGIFEEFRELGKAEEGTGGLGESFSLRTPDLVEIGWP